MLVTGKGGYTLLMTHGVRRSLMVTVKSTKSHGISPTASRWNRSHSKIDVGIGPKIFFAEGGLMLLPSGLISYLRNYEVTKSCDNYCTRFCSLGKHNKDIPTL